MFKRIQRYISRRLLNELEKKSLRDIANSQHNILLVPFLGTSVPVLVRELTQAQIMSCGDFSMIETIKDRISKKQRTKSDILEIVEYAERHHEVCKRALVKPTYNQIIESITDSSIETHKKRIQAIKEKLKETKPSPERSQLEKELDILRVWTDLILPDDFTSTIVSYVLGIDHSDIKSVTEEALLQAAVLAERGHDNPADHIHGKFTEFMKDDINTRAWLILTDYRESRKNGS